MELYKCDRCGRIMERSERFFGQWDGYTADLCEVCCEEFRKNKESAIRNFERNKTAILHSFGLTHYKELMLK